MQNPVTCYEVGHCLHPDDTTNTCQRCGCPVIRTQRPAFHDLSKTMLECVIYAEAHGGILHRAPGGFWILESDRAKVPHCHSYGTKTIEALVSRGYGQYTGFQEGRKGKFPISVAINRYKSAPGALNTMVSPK